MWLCWSAACQGIATNLLLQCYPVVLRISRVKKCFTILKTFHNVQSRSLRLRSSLTIKYDLSTTNLWVTPKEAASTWQKRVYFMQIPQKLLALTLKLLATKVVEKWDTHCLLQCGSNYHLSSQNSRWILTASVRLACKRPPQAITCLIS